jgi:hypothetical protein
VTSLLSYQFLVCVEFLLYKMLACAYSLVAAAQRMNGDVKIVASLLQDGTWKKLFTRG